eukprot:TRINITY_DN2468_c0_g1_i1.p1 TRINITY_DN2468_c0_g1~~TRINITY_DN2468_c0_g1_i1.p1  ORF type:complete len:475 (-),score=138.28 TRINITY_DN2468_c0_g1_i1:50-1474(-)
MTVEDLFAPDTNQRQAGKVDNEKLKNIGLTQRETEGWQKLRARYLSKKPVIWTDVKSVAPSFFDHYDDMPGVKPDDIKNLMDKVAVIKFNGGLGIKMGLKGPKSAIEVENGHSFLDLAVLHIEHLNKIYGVDIPLILMDSFNTHDNTSKAILKYDGQVNISTFQQSKFPRFFKDTLNPVPKSSSGVASEWYPPGSGDVFQSLEASGLLDQLINSGKEYIFMSNVENLGASLDVKILQHMIGKGLEYALEVTDRISTDITGGVLVTYKESVHLMELSQVPHEKHTKFNAREYKYWNTNNLWVNTKSIKEHIASNSLELDFVVSVVGDGGRAHVLIETPAGMAIQNFKKAEAIHVPRERYRPVKSTSQLMVAQSNLFQFSNGQMVMNSKREPANVPLVKLGDDFHTVADYSKRFKGVPDILELEHLTVSGDVNFGAGVVLKGTVIIVANHGERIDIPDGVILENKIISGNLRILDH